jgi:hypothetical protein
MHVLIDDGSDVAMLFPPKVVSLVLSVKCTKSNEFFLPPASLKAQRTQRGSFLSEWREGGHSDKPATLRVEVLHISLRTSFLCVLCVSNDRREWAVKIN